MIGELYKTNFLAFHAQWLTFMSLTSPVGFSDYEGNSQASYAYPMLWAPVYKSRNEKRLIRIYVIFTLYHEIETFFYSRKFLSLFFFSDSLFSPNLED